MHIELTPDLLLHAYQQGLFPMADNAQSQNIHWVCPEMRGQLPIEQLHIPKNLKKWIKRGVFDVRIDTAFTDVIKACALQTNDRKHTWINQSIIDNYCALHEQGHAHSIECWQNDKLVGGLYGLKIGGAFFGESMFSRVDNASKVALVHLAARLYSGGFQILDTQFVNTHLEQFGVYEIPSQDYIKQLQGVLHFNVEFLHADKSEKQIIDSYLQFKSQA